MTKHHSCCAVANSSGGLGSAVSIWTSGGHCYLCCILPLGHPELLAIPKLLSHQWSVLLLPAFLNARRTWVGSSLPLPWNRVSHWGSLLYYPSPGKFLSFLWRVWGCQSEPGMGRTHECDAHFLLFSWWGNEDLSHCRCCSHRAGLGTASQRNSQTTNKIEIISASRALCFIFLLISLSSDFHSGETSKTLVMLSSYWRMS